MVLRVHCSAAMEIHFHCLDCRKKTRCVTKDRERQGRERDKGKREEKTEREMNKKAR